MKLDEISGKIFEKLIHYRPIVVPLLTLLLVEIMNNTNLDQIVDKDVVVLNNKDTCEIHQNKKGELFTYSSKFFPETVLVDTNRDGNLDYVKINFMTRFGGKTEYQEPNDSLKKIFNDVYRLSKFNRTYEVNFCETSRGIEGYNFKNFNSLVSVVDSNLDGNADYLRVFTNAKYGKSYVFNLPISERLKSEFNKAYKSKFNGVSK